MGRKSVMFAEKCSPTLVGWSAISWAIQELSLYTMKQLIYVYVCVIKIGRNYLLDHEATIVIYCNNWCNLDQFFSFYNQLFFLYIMYPWYFLMKALDTPVLYFLVYILKVLKYMNSVETKPYSCHLCGWGFYQKCNMDRHMTSHSKVIISIYTLI